MERNLRTTLQGVVISTKMAKTIVVEVETHKRHPKYLKRIKYSNRYYAHDEKEIAHEGDTVTIMGCRPLSATKRFRLVSVDKKAVAAIKVEEAEMKLEEKAEKVAETKVAPKKAPVKKAEPKAEPVKEEVKVEAPKAEEVKVEEKPVEAKKAPAKKAPAKKATTAAKKPAAKKAPAKKAAAKKAE